MILPLRARKLIREYSKPLTRPNWKTQPSMSLYKFYTNVDYNKKNYLLIRLSYKILDGYESTFLYMLYMNKLYKHNYNKKEALNDIYLNYDIEPKIINLVIKKNKKYTCMPK
jgi:hypothetical protein